MKTSSSPGRALHSHLYWIAVSVILVAGFIPRFYDIAKFLPYYSIDENDVVEVAVGFLGRDLAPSSYRYGPLYAYLLAAVFALQALFHPNGVPAFAQGVFYSPSAFYYTARCVNSCLNVMLALITYGLARRYSSSTTARVALLLAVFPFYDLLTGFTVRVDTLLAVWSTLALVCLMTVSETGKTRHYVLSGLFIGLGLATKPLPALLILPVAFLAHGANVWKAVVQGQSRSGRRVPESPMPALEGATRSERRRASIGRVVACSAQVLLQRKLLALVLAAGVSNVVFNPYALVHARSYLKAQVRLVLHEGQRDFAPGWDLSQLIPYLGHMFVVASVVAVAYGVWTSLRRPGGGSRLVMISYPIIFWSAFAMGAARDYFYVPILPAIVVLISELLTDVSRRAKQTRLQPIVLYGAVILIMLQPAATLLRRSISLNSSRDYKTLHTAIAGEDWIKSHLPRAARILLYGYYVNLPHLVDRDPDEQAVFGEHFMGGRDRMAFLREQFRQAHHNYVASGGAVFNLYGIRQDLGDDLRTLWACCRSNGIDYVVTSHNLDAHEEFRGRVLRTFGRPQYPFGVPFAIYKVTDE